MKKMLLLAILMLLAAAFCSYAKVLQEQNAKNGLGYLQVDAKAAKALMESKKGYVILDVRTATEYNAGHIANSILIPDYEITKRAEKELKDKNQLILIYCRSGRRSKLAAADLVKLGYTNVVEFGGIIDWQYGVVK